ncbi:MAG: LPXTG cell wall anchor domain-containing protein [Candidatus Shapirobacteria bacterium]
MAFIGGALIGVTMIIFFKKKKNSRMPFGPFLIGATLISWFWGEKLLLFFYSWF